MVRTDQVVNWHRGLDLVEDGHFTHVLQAELSDGLALHFVQGELDACRWVDCDHFSPVFCGR